MNWNFGDHNIWNKDNDKQNNPFNNNDNGNDYFGMNKDNGQNNNGDNGFHFPFGNNNNDSKNNNGNDNNNNNGNNNNNNGNHWWENIGNNNNKDNNQNNNQNNDQNNDQNNNLNNNNNINEANTTPVKPVAPAVLKQTTSNVATSTISATSTVDMNQNLTNSTASETNLNIEEKNNKGLPMFPIILVTVVIAGIAFFIIRKRKNEKEKQEIFENITFNDNGGLFNPTYPNPNYQEYAAAFSSPPKQDYNNTNYQEATYSQGYAEPTVQAKTYDSNTQTQTYDSNAQVQTYDPNAQGYYQQQTYDPNAQVGFNVPQPVMNDQQFINPSQPMNNAVGSAGYVAAITNDKPQY